VFIVKNVKGKSRVIGRRKATGPVLKNERANSEKSEDAKLKSLKRKLWQSVAEEKIGFRSRRIAGLPSREEKVARFFYY